ncbi:hypothetical protein SAMN05443248_4989 [Bradyrhizobium erythrophlei]|uniref:Uncharacterized protein n=1 Tax=Bradyrhizobium erythrophlei TaxID=1437360 RepID=A0A1M5TFZ9_9BRAD|nr:hypothetical protein SAMN05443248_4989 [Bradyrhizobium erythrophlei]
MKRPTFAASAVGLALPATGATDAVCISGSATKIVRIKGVAITGVNANAQTATANLVLRSAANTGGTSTSPTVVPLDSNDAAGTAAVKAYTVAPTPGTVRPQSIPFPLAASAAQYPPVIWDFTPANLSSESPAAASLSWRRQPNNCCGDNP